MITFKELVKEEVDVKIALLLRVPKSDEIVPLIPENILGMIYGDNVTSEQMCYWIEELFEETEERAIVGFTLSSEPELLANFILMQKLIPILKIQGKYFEA